MMAVHVGLPSADPVDIEVTTLGRDGRRVTRVTGVDPRTTVGKPVLVKAG
jgi:hypothetical protein